MKRPCEMERTRIHLSKSSVRNKIKIRIRIKHRNRNRNGRKSAAIDSLLLLLILIIFSSVTASHSNGNHPNHNNNKSFAPTAFLHSHSHSHSHSNPLHTTKPMTKSHIIRNETSAARDAAAYNWITSSSVDILHATAQSSSSGTLLTLQRSARDVDSNTRRTFFQHLLLPPNPASEESTITVLPPVECHPKLKARIPSPSGDKLALVYQHADSSSSSSSSNQNTRYEVEIWTGNQQSLLRRIRLRASVHGTIRFDSEWFGAPKWNDEETALVYSAEASLPPVSSFFDDVEKEGVGGQHVLHRGRVEDWGEKYVGTSHLQLYLLNVDTGRVGRVPSVPKGCTLGQAVWSPCGEFVVYVAWDSGSAGEDGRRGGGGEMARRLGMIYCFQRPCKVYVTRVSSLLRQLGCANDESDGDGDNGKDGAPDENEDWYTCLTPNDRLARSPRFYNPSKHQHQETNDQNDNTPKLIYLCSPDGFDTHQGCMELHSLHWNPLDKNDDWMPSRRTVVAEVGLPTWDETGTIPTVANMSFPGLFLGQLPQDTCFSPDGRFVYLTTQWGSVSKVVKISMEDGTVVPLRFHWNENRDDNPNGMAEHASQTLLCLTECGDAIVSQSEPNCPPILGRILSHHLSTNNESQQLPCQCLAKLPPIAASSSSPVPPQKPFTFDYHLIHATPTHGDVRVPIQGILLLPNDANDTKRKYPLIVVPHGGPHSCTSTTYLPSYAYLCQHGGYAILHANYRGSSGFGRAPLEDLPGKIGTLDVGDVKLLTETAIASFLHLDGNRVGICGGSHGGFLAGHVIGQHPSLFQVAAMRNPVTNIASMVTATDIPDWCHVETYGPRGGYDFGQFRGPTREELGRMWDASPIAHVEKVRAPTLVALGMADRRVPPSQGLEYYYALRSRGVESKLLGYEDDDHAIDGVASEADHWINIKRWFDQYL